MVGIFLSLGLGMMIGITLENQNVIENQQTQLIHQIEDNFASLQSEAAQLKMELTSVNDQRDQLHDLSSLMFKEVIQNRLSNVHVGVITFSLQNPMEDILEFLHFAGVTVESALTLLPNKPADNEKTVHVVQGPDEFTSTMIEELIYNMKYGEMTPLVEEAENIFIHSHIRQYLFPVDFIILLGQGTTTLLYENILVDKAKEAGITVVAVETGQVDTSNISNYKNWGISTVDHVESIYGRLALASILSGHTGNFGFGEDALDRLPSPLFYSGSEVPGQIDIINEGGNQ
jgi:hypothetical protein